MIEANQKRTCMQCGREECNGNISRRIHILKIGKNNISLCSTCLLSVKRQVLDMSDRLYEGIPNAKETDYDKEVFPLLELLLNCKIAGVWNEGYQSNMDGLDPKKMCNSNRLIYEQILNW